MQPSQRTGRGIWLFRINPSATGRFRGVNSLSPKATPLSLIGGGNVQIANGH